MVRQVQISAGVAAFPCSRSAATRGGCSDRGGRGMLSACPHPKASHLPPPLPRNGPRLVLLGTHWFPARLLGSRCREPCQGNSQWKGKCTGRGTGDKGITCDPPNLTTATETGVFRQRHPGWNTTSPRAACEVFPGERRPFPAEAPDQSKTRALSWCSGECSCRGGHKGNKGSRITSECINYFQ